MGKASQEARKSAIMLSVLMQTLPQHIPQRDTADVVRSEWVFAPDGGLIISTEQSHLAAVWEGQIEMSIYYLVPSILC